MKYIFFFFLLLSSLIASGKPLEKVSIQLAWLHQFQFAGYYMAKEKGFYTKAGLNVEIKEFAYGNNVVKDVLESKSEYGVGRSSLIKFRTEGKKIVLLSAIFQSSPIVLIALKSSNINTISDFEGKKFMMTETLVETASIHAMITSAKVDENSFTKKKHNFDLQELIDSKVDLYAGYVSNEPFILKQKNIPYKLFYPSENGFDFYSDILFTSEKELEKHPLRVKKFRDASLEGWKYAFEHIEESAQLIYKKYNPHNKSLDALRFEAEELKKLALKDGVKLGEINTNKLERIYDVYKLMGLTKSSLDTDEFLYKETIFSKEEREYLRDKKEIKICVHPNSKPYSAIENGKYIGIGSQILELVKKEIEIPYKLVDTSSWMDSILKGKNRECDLLPIATKTPSREHFFKFTTPYHSEPLVVVTNDDKNYIVDFEAVLNHTFSIVKGHAYIKELKNKYPNIKLKLVDTTQSGLLGVKDLKYYGHIDVLMGAAYGMKKIPHNNFQISGQFPAKIDVSFGIRKDDKILYDIFEKIALNLKPSDLQNMIDDWVLINYHQEKNFIYLYETFLFILFISIIFFLRQNILKKKNSELELLQDKLKAANKNLALRVSEATYELERAQEVAKIGSWIFNNREGSLKWSKETYNIFGLEQGVEYLHADFIQRIHPDDKEKVEDAYRVSLAEKKGYSIEHRILMDDGSIKYILETCETTFDEEGRALISHGTAQDITSSVMAKLELKKKDAFMLQQSRLAQMGEMLSMIAHQWKQPLTAIGTIGIALKAILELEKYDLNDAAQRKDFLDYLETRLDKIALYVQNLSQTITDFSDFYKPNKQAILLDVNDVIDKAYSLVEDKMKSSMIEVEFNLELNSKIMMHENEFMQVILNIINNASEQLIQNKISSPKIIISDFMKEQRLHITIEDNAGGIDESIMDEIFEPYSSTKLEKNGTGLGLYMSKTIIKDYHNGDIYAKNNDLGAIFTIVLDKQA